ncbi:MAG: succinate dehydrogenase, hydrophobic membrane anchor protein [Alphaproteobacteria bacterium]
MRTALGKVRGLGSARDGTGHFWHQRLTALANIPLTLFLVYVVIANLGSSYQETVAFLAHPLVAAALLALILSACYHMALGLQVIIEDYVHSEGLKIVALVANTFFPVAVGLAAAVAVLKLSIGG